MALTVLERIALNVLSSAQAVTTGNGYDDTLIVERAKKTNEIAHLKAVIYQQSPDIDESGSMNCNSWIQGFVFVVYVIPTADDETPVDTYNNRIAAALHKQLMIDYTRGGLAVQTVIKPTLYFSPMTGETAGISFFIDVYYRHALDDPYTPIA